MLLSPEDCIFDAACLSMGLVLLSLLTQGDNPHRTPMCAASECCVLSPLAFGADLLADA